MRISRWSSIAGVGLAAVVVSLTTFACTRGSAFEGVGTTASGRDTGQYVRAVSPQAFEAIATDSRPVVVTCGPGQRAVVRPSMLRGEQVSQVECLGEPYAAVPAYGAAPVYGPYDRPVIVDSYPRAIPVASEVRTVRTVPVQRRVVTERRSGRSWKKTALVIGGSTATGAGIGGIIGGKKGALIGAAIGGGASSIYEAAKR